MLYLYYVSVWLWVSVFLQACGVLWLLNILACGVFWWCFMHMYWCLYAWTCTYLTWGVLVLCSGLAVGDFLMWSTRYSYQILMKLEFSGQIFEKYPNIKFHENLSGGRQVVPCGQMDGQIDRQTDRHDEASERASKLWILTTWYICHSHNKLWWFPQTLTDLFIGIQINTPISFKYLIV